MAQAYFSGLEESAVIPGQVNVLLFPSLRNQNNLSKSPFPCPPRLFLQAQPRTCYNQTFTDLNIWIWIFFKEFDWI